MRRYRVGIGAGEPRDLAGGLPWGRVCPIRPSARGGCGGRHMEPGREGWGIRWRGDPGGGRGARR
jgi:hypothetical protein